MYSYHAVANCSGCAQTFPVGAASALPDVSEAVFFSDSLWSVSAGMKRTICPYPADMYALFFCKYLIYSSVLSFPMFFRNGLSDFNICMISTFICMICVIFVFLSADT